jgi:uncharacterized membrane protein
MQPRPWLIVVIVGAVVGALFAGIATYDFVQHLDRQVHSIHCSFVPGGGGTLGPSGCQTALMSPYSSMFRSLIWGGIPISLAALSVFAFIAFFAADLALSRRQRDVRATAFLALACALPALASIVMLTISLTKLHTACTQCIAIYISSAACLVGSIVTWRQAVKNREEVQATTNQFLAGAFSLGVLFVAAPIALYVMMAPDHARFVGTCDGLAHPEDPYGVMVPIGKHAANAAPAIEILDPLCPACRAFEERLDDSGMKSRLARQAVLFPLDSTCNWMVDDKVHPGACTISEAVLCAGDRAGEVVDWAFANQKQIRDETKADPAAAARLAGARFPELAACIGSPEARSRLNKSLRWAVGNGIQVLTPQLYIDNVKLCDEDVDLGLEYALRVALERHDHGTLVATSITQPTTPQRLEATEEERQAIEHANTAVTTGKPTTHEEAPAATTPATPTEPAATAPANPTTTTPTPTPPTEAPPAETPPSPTPPSPPPSPPPAETPPAPPAAPETGPVTTPGGGAP